MIELREPWKFLLKEEKIKLEKGRDFFKRGKRLKANDLYVKQSTSN